MWPEKTFKKFTQDRKILRIWFCELYTFIFFFKMCDFVKQIHIFCNFSFFSGFILRGKLKRSANFSACSIFKGFVFFFWLNMKTSPISLKWHFWTKKTIFLDRVYFFKPAKSWKFLHQKWNCECLLNLFSWKLLKIVRCIFCVIFRNSI